MGILLGIILLYRMLKTCYLTRLTAAASDIYCPSEKACVLLHK
jgi:hypothetical protein